MRKYTAEQKKVGQSMLTRYEVAKNDKLNRWEDDRGQTLQKYEEQSKKL